jgi:hypothetical protein
MTPLGRKGQGDALIKLLVVAIIAVIALAMVKSYFREASKKAKKSMEEIFSPIPVKIPPAILILSPLPESPLK